MIQPSSAITVRADTSIEECVRIMKSRDVGSLLVVSDDAKETLIGIFTERDLVRKFDLIQAGKHWGRPVRTLMTKPVITLSVTRIEDAAQIMLDNGFRHLPLVTTDEEGQEHVTGVISMRDIMRDISWPATTKGLSPLRDSNPPRLDVLSRDRPFLRMLRRLSAALADRKSVFLARDLDELLVPIEGLEHRFAIIDVDGLKLEEWSSALLRLSQGRSPAPLTILVYNPSKCDDRALRVLDKLSKSRRFVVFPKPIDVSAFFGRLSLPLKITWAASEASRATKERPAR